MGSSQSSVPSPLASSLSSLAYYCFGPSSIMPDSTLRAVRLPVNDIPSSTKRDRDGRLHTYDDGIGIKNLGHRCDVGQCPSDEGIDDLKGR